MPARSPSIAVPIASVRGVGRIARADLEKQGASYSYGGEEYALHDLGTEAIEMYQQVLDLDPDHAAAHINLGTLHYNRQEYALAEKHYRHAIEVDPRYALAYFDLGNVLDEALEYLAEAGEEAERLDRAALLLGDGRVRGRARVRGSRPIALLMSRFRKDPDPRFWRINRSIRPRLTPRPWAFSSAWIRGLP